MGEKRDATQTSKRMIAIPEQNRIPRIETAIARGDIANTLPTMFILGNRLI
jgi:hypothetical protein